MSVLELKGEVIILLPVSGEKYLEFAVMGRELIIDRRDRWLQRVSLWDLCLFIPCLYPLNLVLTLWGWFHPHFVDDEAHSGFQQLALSFTLGSCVSILH